MTAAEAELVRALKEASTFLLEQQRILKTLCMEFKALSEAVSPLMLSCKDPALLATFHAELTRINAAVNEAAALSGRRLH